MNRREPHPIRVLLVDDHDVVRVALRTVFNACPHLHMVAEASNRDEAINMARKTDPDIILLDVNLNGENGIDIVPDLRDVTTDARIILITGDNKPEAYRRAMRLGVKGVVFKGHATETVTKAIDRVYAGEMWVEPTLLKEILNEPDRPKHEALTTRERAVVELVCQGRRNQEIANHLIIAEATVRHHLTSIFQKLDVQDRVELVIYAYTNELVTPPK